MSLCSLRLLAIFRSISLVVCSILVLDVGEMAARFSDGNLNSTIVGHQQVVIRMSAQKINVLIFRVVFSAIRIRYMYNQDCPM